MPKIILKFRKHEEIQCRSYYLVSKVLEEAIDDLPLFPAVWPISLFSARQVFYWGRAVVVHGG